MTDFCIFHIHGCHHAEIQENRICTILFGEIYNFLLTVKLEILINDCLSVFSLDRNSPEVVITGHHDASAQMFSLPRQRKTITIHICLITENVSMLY